MVPLASGIELPERYRVTRHIASGGMASVWEAQDLRLGRVVAVKVLSPQYAADDAARARFQREARTAARVSEHAHIATIYDTGVRGADAYIVMEYFSGGSVADRLRAAKDDGRRIPRETALRWLQEAAAALDAAHAAGIVHRDVKPANLLIDARERLAVGDFGIARLADDTHMTQTGQVLGTAAYLSPEQAFGQPATAASDRYALAVVAYELLTGSRPFPGGPPSAQARQHAEDPPGPATAAAPDLPLAIDAVFERALAKAPADRPQTAVALVAELERALRAPAPAPVEPTRPVPVPVPVPVPEPLSTAPPRAAADPVPPPPAAPQRRDRRPAFSPLLPVAAAALVSAVVLVIVIAGGGDGGTDGSPSQTAPRTSAAASGDPQATPPAQAEQPATSSDPGSAGAASSEDPSELNNRGYELLQDGDYAAAVPLLRAAVDGFRSAGRTDDLNYAYALFNLAVALTRSGDPGAAIEFFEERLRFNNQRGTVTRALREAQAQLADNAGEQENENRDEE